MLPRRLGALRTLVRDCGGYRCGPLPGLLPNPIEGLQVPRKELRSETKGDSGPGGAGCASGSVDAVCGLFSCASFGAWVACALPTTVQLPPAPEKTSDRLGFSVSLPGQDCGEK